MSETKEHNKNGARQSNARLLRLDCLHNTCEFFDILEQHGPHIPLDDAERCLTCVTSALLSYAALSRSSIQKGVKMWSVVPKFHYLWHAAYFARFQNPRMGWVFKDEDYMGRIARIAHSCSFGVHTRDIGVPLMFKYNEAMSLRVTRRSFWS